MGAENSHGTAVALRFLELLSAGAPAWRFEEFVLEARAKGADRETFEYLGRAKRLALEVGDRVSRGRQRKRNSPDWSMSSGSSAAHHIRAPRWTRSSGGPGC